MLAIITCLYTAHTLTGAIELSILSDSYETELHVVDVQTNRIDKFGKLKLLCLYTMLCVFIDFVNVHK